METRINSRLVKELQLINPDINLNSALLPKYLDLTKLGVHQQLKFKKTNLTWVALSEAGLDVSILREYLIRQEGEKENLGYGLTLCYQKSEKDQPQPICEVNKNTCNTDKVKSLNFEHVVLKFDDAVRFICRVINYQLKETNY